MDKAVLVMLMPFIIAVLIVGWLFYASHGNKRVRLGLKGLGITIDIQTANADEPKVFKTRATDKQSDVPSEKE